MSLIKAGLDKEQFDATLAAFAGAFAGTRLLKKLTIRAVQLCVAGMLTVVAQGLMTGLL